MVIKTKNMIQVNEIRQGNYLLDRFNEIEELIQFDTFNWLEDDYCGIKLNDDWFNNCGFSKKVLKTKTFYTNGNVEFEKGNKRSGCYYLRGWKGYHKGIKYLHELQNLYFNLIGDDLTVSN